jgi:hypothetical protein
MLNMEKYFEGYDVPEEIKQLSTAICTRFAISGLCDPMYIANTIAHTNGFGDGCGHFTSETVIDAAKTAERIQWAYGCNILKTEKPELENILKTGRISKTEAANGLQAFRQRTREEMRHCDAWRVDYLKRLIKQIDQCAEAIEREAA